MHVVVNALKLSDSHGPVAKTFKIPSNQSALYAVATRRTVTTGTNVLFKSCLVNNQINVDVVKC